MERVQETDEGYYEPNGDVLEWRWKDQAQKLKSEPEPKPQPSRRRRKVTKKK